MSSDCVASAELPVSSASEADRRWWEQDGIISFSVTSRGLTGPQWIEHLEKLGLRVSDEAKSVLLSPDFKPTNGVTYQIAIVPGTLFLDQDRSTEKIRVEADLIRLTPLRNAEVGCLIRENFSDEEIKAMGLWLIVAMHEPIQDLYGNPTCLGAFRLNGGCWLHGANGSPSGRWERYAGFAFEAPPGGV